MPQLPQYIDFAEITIRQQLKRSTKYYKNATILKLEQILHSTIIAQHIQQIISNHELKQLFQSKRVYQVLLLRNLFEKVGKVNQLIVFWGEQIFQNGIQVVRKAKQIDGLFSKPKIIEQSVREILDVIYQSDEMLQKAFENQLNFKLMQKSACQRFLNQESNFNSQLLAKYLNAFLRRGGQGGSLVSGSLAANTTFTRQSSQNSQNQIIEEKFGDVLNNIIKIFKFLNAKDTFQAFYRKGLVKRLLGKKSVSDQADFEVLRKLKLECGAEYTKKMEAMFQDIQKSNVIQNKFKQVFLTKKRAVNDDNGQEVKQVSGGGDRYNFTVNIQVLQSGAWPIQNEKPKILSLPAHVTLFQDDFEKFYKKQHQGVRLQWDYFNGMAEIQGKFQPKANKPPSRVTFRLPQRMALILMLFNEKKTNSFKQIQQILGINKRDVEDDLASFVYAKGPSPKLIIYSSNKDSGPIQENDQFVINDNFTSKRKMVPISRMVKRQVQQKEQEQVLNQVREHRGVLLDTFIVRVMKTRKELSNELLMEEVIKLARFQFERPQFKQRIQLLIEKQFIKRDEDDRTLFHYIA